MQNKSNSVDKKCDRNSKQNSKSRGKRNYQRKTNEAVDKTALPGRVDNDPNWYFTSAEVADQASTFSFNEFLGSKSWYSGRIYDSTDKSFKYYSFGLANPNVLVGYLNPSPGTTRVGFQEMSGINAVALKTYTMLSSRNGKTTSYAPQDISMLILAMGELVSMMEFIRRAFGVAYTYNQRNRNLPKRLIETMAIDYDDMSSHMADYRMRFNSLITTINKIPFPVNVAYISKCAALYQNIYLDSESSMASIVYMRPFSTWLIDEIGSDTGTQLVTQTIPSPGNPAPLSTWFDTISTMINAVLTSSTFNFIFSDILMLRDKYSMPLMVLDYLSNDYAVIPQYNPVFMLQIHNSTVTGVPISEVYGDITTKNNDVVSDPDNNMIKYCPRFDSIGYVPDGALIDFPVSNPDVPMRIEATRFTSVPNPRVYEAGDPAVSTAVMLYYLPDHYVVAYDLYYGSGSNSDSVTYKKQWSALSDMTVGDMALQGINMSPMLMQYQFYGAGDARNSIATMSTLDFFTFLPAEWFYRVNDLTFMALFEVR